MTAGTGSTFPQNVELDTNTASEKQLMKHFCYTSWLKAEKQHFSHILIVWFNTVVVSRGQLLSKNLQSLLYTQTCDSEME